nr:YmaF family protein [Clostridium aminobutyricum]
MQQSCAYTADTGYPMRQSHVHEVLGSVKIEQLKTDPHNHRFATLTSQGIPVSGNNHIHELRFCTDFYEDHYHEFSGKTGVALPVGDGRHVHFIDSVTFVREGHCHEFKAATLINDPIGD